MSSQALAVCESFTNGVYLPYYYQTIPPKENERIAATLHLFQVQEPDETWLDFDQAAFMFHVNRNADININVNWFGKFTKQAEKLKAIIADVVPEHNPTSLP